MRQPSNGGSPSRIRGILAIASVFLAFVVIGVLILHGGLPRVFGDTSAITTPATPTATAIPLKLTLSDHLTSIDMHSSTEGWIVGSSGQSGQTILLRYSRGAWVTDPLQLPQMNPAVIKMFSATEGWIAGGDTQSYDSRGVMLHISNGQALPVALPDGVGAIEDLAMVSPTDGWAVTAPSTQQNTQILHYSQGVWAVALTVPDNNANLLSIDMVSSDEGWAAGIGTGSGALWHYTQGKWLRIPLNDPQQADIEHISMLSATEGWGIGEIGLPHQPNDQYNRVGGAIWHYSNGAWQVAKRVIEDPSQPQLTILSVIQTVAPGEIWVSQFQPDLNSKVFIHSVNGTWQEVRAAIRDGITSIAMLTPSDGWAVGAAGQIMQCRSGVWFDYPTL